MRRLIILLALLAPACGDETPQAPKKAPPTEGQARGMGGGATGTKKAEGARLVLKPKVDKMYRKECTPADFQPDPTGDVNRDPFVSYLVSPAAAPGQAAPIADECLDRKVAEKYAYNDLRLIGIVMRGT